MVHDRTINFINQEVQELYMNWNLCTVHELFGHEPDSSWIYHLLFMAYSRTKSQIVHKPFINYKTIHELWTSHESVFHELL